MKNNGFRFNYTFPERQWYTGSDSSNYRFGFNGQEKDAEIKGINNSINFKFRLYDPRISRFFAVDPLFPEYPELTPYQVSSINPIWMFELEGLEGVPCNKTVFIYYVGFDDFDGFGLFGHTSAGIYNPKDPNGTTFYGPFSGHSGETELRKYDHGDVIGISEGKTIKQYLDGGEIVQRIHYNLSEVSSEYVEGAIDNNVRNNYDGDGFWCTLQVYNMLKDAFIDEGYPEDIASEKANKIIPYSLPEELSQSEILVTGSIRYDRFYKKEGKYYHDEFKYDSDKKEWTSTTTEIKDFDKYFSTESDE